MFPIRAIHQIEMTSRCNLRCRYCAHPTMARVKADMDDATFAKALLWARQLPSHELNLAGIGESTMHPEFVRTEAQGTLPSLDADPVRYRDGGYFAVLRRSA